MTQTDSIDNTPPAPTDRRAEVLLQVAGANKSFGRGVWPFRRSLQVLDGADLRVYRGEIVGLVGENGSGKSTLMQIVVGLLAADGGIVQRPDSLGYCPQSAMLWDKLTVDEHFSLFARAYDMNETARDRAVSALLEELQFERYRGFLVEQLSGGTKQKLNLALALMHDPATAAARRTLFRIRLGNLPAFLGDERVTARRRDGNPDRFALPFRT